MKNKKRRKGNENKIDLYVLQSRRDQTLNRVRIRESFPWSRCHQNDNHQSVNITCVQCADKSANKEMQFLYTQISSQIKDRLSRLFIGTLSTLKKHVAVFTILWQSQLLKNGSKIWF